LIRIQSWARQVFLCADSPQSDFSASGVQPIESFSIENQKNQVISLAVSHLVRLFRLKIRSIRVYVAPKSDIQTFLAERSANSLSWA
jgi:hypothetical protein